MRAPALLACCMTASTCPLDNTLCPSVNSVGLGAPNASPASWAMLLRGQSASRTPACSRQGQPETLGLGAGPCHGLWSPSGCAPVRLQSHLPTASPAGQERTRVRLRQEGDGAGGSEETGRVMAPRHGERGGKPTVGTHWK